MPEVAVLTGLPLSDRGAARERLDAWAAVGATRLITGGRYANADEFRAHSEALGSLA